MRLDVMLARCEASVSAFVCSCRGEGPLSSCHFLRLSAVLDALSTTARFRPGINVPPQPFAIFLLGEDVSILLSQEGHDLENRRWRVFVDPRDGLFRRGHNVS
eukprot:s171_g25.t1